MKLIPVQMVNGQFFRSPISKPKTNTTPQKAVTISIPSSPVQVVKKAAMNPSASQQVVRKQFSLVNALPNQVGLDPSNSINKHSPQQQKLMAKGVQMASPAAANCETSGRLPGQLSETMQSPALPRGQCLQIPPHAQMRKTPTSELPPGIKKQIFICPGSGVPSVNQGNSARHSLDLLSKTSNRTSCRPPSKGSKKHLKLIPAVPQRPNSPIKWMVEEEESSTAPTLNPLHSPSVTSEILSAVAEREKASKQCRDVSTKPVPQLNPGRCAVQEKVTFTCNGKVFFVVRRDSQPPRVGKSDLKTAGTKSYELNKTEVPLSRPSLESAATETRQRLRIIIPDQSDEVIDLCDEDEKDDSSQQAEVTHWDEDNVIFVSYIPPKSESGSAQDLILKETDQMGTHRPSSVTQQKRLDGPTGTDGRDEICALGGRTPENVRNVNNCTHVCGSAVVSMHADEGSNINRQQSVATHQLESMDVETESPADPSPSDGSSRVFSLTGKDTHKMEVLWTTLWCFQAGKCVTIGQ